jgi:ribosomal protein RSM22 (predicted rRNA methylase)
LSQIPDAKSFVDLGAGPGTASWAASLLFSGLEKITLVERSPQIIKMGKVLAKRGPLSLQNASWVQQTLQDPIPSADVGMLSYVVGEIHDYKPLIKKCFEAFETLVIVEPGTPRAFSKLKAIRQELLSLGGFILAPCPHSFLCPSDWCHFSVRLPRTKLHRLLKEGSLGYEDEKFCYLIVQKKGARHEKDRIVRHPFYGKGHIKFELCNRLGVLEQKVISKKDKELYKIARDAEWGDLI